MRETLRKALTLLNAAERRHFRIVLAMSAAASVVQTVSLLSIMPFIVLLSNPDLLESNRYVARITDALGLQSYRQFLLLFGVLGVVLLTVGNLFVAFSHWLAHRFQVLTKHRIQTLVLQRMLQKPYEYFVGNHSAQLGDVVLRQVDRVVTGVIIKAESAFNGFVLTAFIVLALLAVSLKTTLLSLAGLVAAYLLVFVFLRRRIRSHGRELTRLSASAFKAVKETLDGMREIRTRRAERFFSQRFERSNLRLSKLAIQFGVMVYLPHYLLETIVFAGIVVIALYFVFTTADTGVSLSFVALYGISVYRLTPALRSIFDGLSAIHHNAPAVDLVLEHVSAGTERLAPAPAPHPQRQIAAENVSYRYPGSPEDQVRAIDFSIPVGSSVCLFGPSGAGKSTVLNLLAALIFPEQGRILCDDTPIDHSVADSWRQRIGYSPQHVYLFEDSIASNIAFGVEFENIDHQRVAEVGRIANLTEFVERLPGGYETLVGEHGATLSGGQCQRLGIARALYHDPDVLMFDESFASLDAKNKDAILERLFAMEGKTLIFSSHEMDIAARCDRMLVMTQGALTATGNYAELTGEKAGGVGLPPDGNTQPDDAKRWEHSANA